MRYYLKRKLEYAGTTKSTWAYLRHSTTEFKQKQIKGVIKGFAWYPISVYGGERVIKMVVWIHYYG